MFGRQGRDRRKCVSTIHVSREGAHTAMAEMPKHAENLTLATSGEDGSVCERMTFRLHHGQMSAPREDAVRAERFIPHLVARARLVGPTR